MPYLRFSAIGRLYCVPRTAQRANGRLELLFTTRNYILEQALAQIDDSQPLIAELCQRAVYIAHNSATKLEITSLNI